MPRNDFEPPTQAVRLPEGITGKAMATLRIEFKFTDTVNYELRLVAEFRQMFEVADAGEIVGERRRSAGVEPVNLLGHVLNPLRLHTASPCSVKSFKTVAKPLLGQDRIPKVPRLCRRGRCLRRRKLLTWRWSPLIGNN